MPVVQACNPSYSRRQRLGQWWFKASLGKEFTRPYLEKTHHQIGLMEWLKVVALSSNPSTVKKKFFLNL
jgi:hypothetical protein